MSIESDHYCSPTFWDGWCMLVCTFYLTYPVHTGEVVEDAVSAAYNAPLHMEELTELLLQLSEQTVI